MTTAKVLLWRLGESESAEEWVAFLELLEAQGIRGAQGLCLIIHDGGVLFHKLRNIAQAIRLPEGLTRKQRRQQRRKILKYFRLIWAARRYQTMLQRYLQVVRTYRDTQPEAVATLRRDFRATVTYYVPEAEFPDWERKHLRTTSCLERFNGTIRRRTKVANAYHSGAGLKAMNSQEIRYFHDAQTAP